jgi:anti-anti-sigma factor
MEENLMTLPKLYLPLKLERSGNVTVVTFAGGTIRGLESILAGELDARTDWLEECHLLLDFTNVEHIRGVELGTLITLGKKMKVSGVRLTLFNLNPHVYEVLMVTNLHTLFGICREEPIPALLPDV